MMSVATGSAVAEPASGSSRPLLTTRDLAARLKVSRGTAQNLIYSGAIRSQKIRRARRVSEEALAEYLAETTAPTSALRGHDKATGGGHEAA